MKMRPLNAMFGLATATLLACSSAPPPPTGAAGAGGTATGTGGTPSGTGGTPSGTGGTPSGTGGTPSGTGGTPSGTGGTGGSPAGTGGATAGTTGTGGATAGTTGAAGVGAAGTTGTGGASSCPAGVLGHCNADTAAAPTHAGYTLALAEEFDNPIDLNNDPIWTWSDGSPADGQTRFRSSQITFAGGKMVITAQPPAGCAGATANPKCIPGGDTTYAEPNLNNATGTISPMGIWSGEFRTHYNNYRYGWYEAKYHAPDANPGHETDVNLGGGFLSTMFVFRSPKWQTWNEIDIELEPNVITNLAGNVVVAQGATSYPGGAAFDTAMGLAAGYKISDEHTYAFEWTPTKANWYVDGVMSHTYMGGNPPIPSKSAKIMMNLWVFDGAHFGDSANNKYPISSEYEYFHFYRLTDKTQEPTYPCSPTPTCLPASDLMFAQNNAMEMNYGK